MALGAARAHPGALVEVGSIPGLCSQVRTQACRAPLADSKPPMPLIPRKAECSLPLPPRTTCRLLGGIVVLMDQTASELLTAEKVPVPLGK